MKKSGNANHKPQIPDLKWILARHCDDLQLYANGLSIQAVEEFIVTEAAIYELIFQITEHFKKEKLEMDLKTRRKLDAVKQRLIDIRGTVYHKIDDLLDEYSPELIRNESEFFWAWLLAFGLPAGRQLARASVVQIAKYGKYHGLTKKQILQKVVDGDTSRIYQTIVTGLLDNNSLSELREAVKREMWKTRRFIKFEVDSIINGVSNDAALAFAAKNELMLVYIAVLDLKVCEECASLDGEVYAHDDSDIPALPRHNHCHCHLIPVAVELDNPRDDLYLSFPDYFETLTAKEKSARIGRAKYRQYLVGNYRIRDFEPPPATLGISIGDLKRRDIASFQST